MIPQQVEESGSRAGRRRRWRPLAWILLWAIAGVLLLAVVLVALLFALEPEDDPPADLSDLAVAVEPVAASEDARHPLESAGQALERMRQRPFMHVLLDDGRTEVRQLLFEIEQLDPDAEPALVALLEQAPASETAGDAILDAACQAGEQEIGQLTLHVEEAIRRGRITIPEADRSYDSELPYLATWRNLGVILAADAGRMRRDGDAGRALDLAMAAVELGSLLERARGLLVHELVALHVKQMGLAEIRRILVAGETPRERLLELAGRLGAHFTCVECFQDCARWEFQMACRVLDEMERGAGPWIDSDPDLKRGAWMLGSGYAFLPNRSRRQFAAIYRKMISDLESPGRDYQAAPDPVEISRGNALAMWRRGNVLGEVLIAVLAPVLGPCVSRRIETDASVSATILMAALFAYRLDHGTLPESLERLVPDTLEALPVDPWDGQPMRYDPEQGELSSAAVEHVPQREREKFRYSLDEQDPR